MAVVVDRCLALFERALLPPGGQLGGRGDVRVRLGGELQPDRIVRVARQQLGPLRLRDDVVRWAGQVGEVRDPPRMRLPLLGVSNPLGDGAAAEAVIARAPDPQAADAVFDFDPRRLAEVPCSDTYPIPWSEVVSTKISESDCAAPPSARSRSLTAPPTLCSRTVSPMCSASGCLRRSRTASRRPACET